MANTLPEIFESIIYIMKYLSLICNVSPHCIICYLCLNTSFLSMNIKLVSILAITSPLRPHEFLNGTCSVMSLAIENLAQTWLFLILSFVAYLFFFFFFIYSKLTIFYGKCINSHKNRANTSTKEEKDYLNMTEGFFKLLY